MIRAKFGMTAPMLGLLVRVTSALVDALNPSSNNKLQYHYSASVGTSCLHMHICLYLCLKEELAYLIRVAALNTLIRSNVTLQPCVGIILSSSS